LSQTCYNLPFGDGQTCAGTDVSPLHFTGKERDTESGLDNFGARFYSASTSRFLSVDPSRSSAQSVTPQSWNRYVYVLNRALIAIDPDGRAVVIVIVKDPRTEGGVGTASVTLLNRAGRTIQSSEALARGGSSNRMAAGGDTPFGVYQYTGSHGGSGTDRLGPQFGTGKIDLEPTAGEALNSGRSDLRMHGGGSDVHDPYEAEQGWEGTHGCVRMQNEDVNSLIGSINALADSGDSTDNIFVGSRGYLTNLALEKGEDGDYSYPELRDALGIKDPQSQAPTMEVPE